MGSKVKEKEERLYMPEDALILTETAVITGLYMKTKLDANGKLILCK